MSVYLSVSHTVLVLLNSTTDTVPVSISEDTNMTDPVITVSATYQRLSIAIAWITLALCIFGMIGNVLSAIIYASSAMRSPINELLLGTSLIDFMLSLLSIPSFVIPGMWAYYEGRTLRILMVYCSAYIYPLTVMMQSASIWAFVVITIERYQAVCRPFHRHWSTLQRSRMAILFVCALSVAYNSVRFLELRIDQVNDTNNATIVDVSPHWRLNDIYMNYYYIGMFLVTHFVVPFFVLVILNAMIIRTICQSRQRRRQLNRKERNEHTTAIMMVIVVVTFICCYTLLFILNILEAAARDWFYTHLEITYALNDISNVLVVLNAASTIVVYYFFSQKYRSLLINLLAACCPAICMRFAGTEKVDPVSMAEQEALKKPSCATQFSPLILSRQPTLNGKSANAKISMTSMNMNLLSTQATDGTNRKYWLIKNDDVTVFGASNEGTGIICDQDDEI